MQMSEKRDVLLFQVGMSWNYFSRNDEHMGRRLRIDVSKSQTLIVLIDDVSGDLPVDDFEKEIVLDHG